ncbi:hypothetical protein D3C86_1731510 [compost metagenome]
MKLEHTGSVFDVLAQRGRNPIDTLSFVLGYRIEIHRDVTIVLLDGVFGHRKVTTGHHILDQFLECLVLTIITHDVTNVAIEIQPLKFVHLVIMLVERSE